MPIYKITIGTPGEASHPDAMKAAAAEFFSMLIFVFAGEESGMTFNKLFLPRISNSILIIGDNYKWKKSWWH